MPNRPETADPTLKSPKHAGSGSGSIPFEGSPEEETAKKSRSRWLWTCIILLVACAACLYYYYSRSTASELWYIVGFALGGGGLSGLITVPFMVSGARKSYEQQERLLNRLSIPWRSSDTEPPSIRELLGHNREEMGVYHRLTIQQAATSFRHGQRAMHMGFGILLLCIVLVALPTPTESKIPISGLGSVSIIISGFITATFLKQHALSVSQLNRFFSQPLVTSYLLTAERVASCLVDTAKESNLSAVVDQALRSAENEREVAAPRSDSSRPSRSGRPVASVFRGRASSGANAATSSDHEQSNHGHRRLVALRSAK